MRRFCGFELGTFGFRQDGTVPSYWPHPNTGGLRPSRLDVSRLIRLRYSGSALNPRGFHRKITSTPGFVVATGDRTTRQGGRPAALYRVGTAPFLHPPMLRPENQSDAGP